MIRSSCVALGIALQFWVCHFGWSQTNQIPEKSAVTPLPTAQGETTEVPSWLAGTPWQGPELLTPLLESNPSVEPLSKESTPFQTVSHETATKSAPAESIATISDPGADSVSDCDPCRDWQLHHAGCDSCDDLFGIRRSHWQFGGWLQQGITFNPDDPANGLNAPVLFNDQANDYQLNQFYLYMGREVRLDGRNWDWGGQFDLNYGTDSRFVTVPGLERHDDRTRKWNSETSDYGLAVPQAYVELGTPLGPYGAVIRVGHFYALSGYESFAAPENFFYSHAYSFLYGQPFTHTGVIMSGKVNETTALSLGVTTGWDAFYDEVDQWGIRYAYQKQFNDGRTVFSVTGHTGEENTGVKDQSGNRRDSRNWINLIWKQQLTNQFYYVLQGDYGRQDSAVVVLDNLNNTVGFEDASWYGISQYWAYQMNSRWSYGLRVEWFRDDGNSRLGLPVQYATGGDAFDGGNYFAITGGLNYKPHQNILLRSELRWDASDLESNPAIPGGVAGIHAFDNRSAKDQLTIGLDAVVLF